MLQSRGQWKSSITLNGGFNMSNNPELLKVGIFSMQVCVPKDWTDEQVEQFANKEHPAGTTHGWTIRKQGSPLLAGADERVTCSQHPDKVHIMLDC